MAYNVLSQAPQGSVTETWKWSTDVIVTENGTEQRASLSALPQRQLTEVVAFDTVDDVNDQIALMIKGFKNSFFVPFFHFAAQLKFAAAGGSHVVKYNPLRTDIRAGEKVLISDRTGWQLATVDTLDVDGCHIVEVLGRTYRAGASICPVSVMYHGSNAQLHRINADIYATANLTLQEAGFRDPFLSPANDAELTMFSGLPVLDKRPVGESFDDTFDTGIDVIDYGGVVTIRSPYDHSKLQFNRQYLSQRLFDPASWNIWPLFGDTVKGSALPFFLPTFRQDFETIYPPSAGLDYFLVKGSVYADVFYPIPAFRAIAVYSDAGVFYANVTLITAAGGGNTYLTLDAAYPAGVDYAAIQKISFLLKCRIADDAIACEHNPTYSVVSINFRTTDE